MPTAACGFRGPRKRETFQHRPHTSTAIREIVLARPFVPGLRKVCAVNDDWSGLRLMVRKERRSHGINLTRFVSFVAVAIRKKLIPSNPDLIMSMKKTSSLPRFYRHREPLAYLLARQGAFPGGSRRAGSMNSIRVGGEESAPD